MQKDVEKLLKDELIQTHDKCNNYSFIAPIFITVEKEDTKNWH